MRVYAGAKTAGAKTEAAQTEAAQTEAAQTAEAMKTGATRGQTIAATGEILVNGKPQTLSQPLTLRQFLETLRLPTLERGVAVSLNGELVRRHDWERTALQPQDELEIVQATQGG